MQSMMNFILWISLNFQLNLLLALTHITLWGNKYYIEFSKFDFLFTINSNLYDNYSDFKVIVI